MQSNFGSSSPFDSGEQQSNPSAADSAPSNDEELICTETSQPSAKLALSTERRLDLKFCDGDICIAAVRQRVVGKHNQIILGGPATGQVAYTWNQDPIINNTNGERSNITLSSVLLLVRPNDEDLIHKAAEVVPKLAHAGVNVLLAPDLAAKLKFHHGVDDERIGLFEASMYTFVFLWTA